MINVYLMGSLGKKFGKFWPAMSVTCAAEALRAIDVNTKGLFFSYLNGAGAKKYFRVTERTGQFLTNEEDFGRAYENNNIYVTPTIIGSNGGVGHIIGGAIIVMIAYVILAVAVYTVNPGLAKIGFMVGKVGVSMIIGGVLQLLVQALVPSPVPVPRRDIEDFGVSTIFEGNAEQVSQGDAISLIYGRVLVSPSPISMSLDTYDRPKPLIVDQHEIIMGDLVGGGTEMIST